MSNGAHKQRMQQRRAAQDQRLSDVGTYPEFLFVAKNPAGDESGVKIALKPGGFVSIRKYDDKGTADALYQWNGTDWTDAHGLLALDEKKDEDHGST